MNGLWNDDVMSLLWVGVLVKDLVVSLVSALFGEGRGRSSFSLFSLSGHPFCFSCFYTCVHSLPQVADSCILFSSVFFFVYGFFQERPFLNFFFILFIVLSHSLPNILYYVYRFFQPR